MKKLINNIEDVIREQLQGFALAHPESVNVHFDPAFIVRADAPVAGKVAIISGGGSGHEPLHGGYVGMGMLDGACPGEIFTSPTPDQMYECALAVNGGAGVLYIVKNYTGDILNFETAVEMAHASGIDVQAVLIDDDVAVKNSLYTAGRRGVGTTVLAEKIVGAAAEAGYDLDQCAELCRKVNKYGRSMGLAITSCITPSAGRPTFDLADDEVEIGIGIHGEPGQRRVKLSSADEIIKILVDEILDDGPYRRLIRDFDRDSGAWIEHTVTDQPFRAGDRLLAFINGMGGTPLSELYTVYRKCVEICDQRGFHIERNLIGPYITSLEMQGVSITLLKVDDEILGFWDAPVNTPGLRWGV